MTRLIELFNRPFTAEDSSWLISSSGLLAACRDIVARDDVATLDMLESSRIWSRLTDVSPHPLGPSLVRRGQLIAAAARLACPSSGKGRPDDDNLDAIAGSIPVGSAEATPELAIGQHLVADLVEWFSSGRPSPVALRRVTFLVDEHSHGRAVRLTLAQFPGASSFAPDVVANPFTMVDTAFAAALDNARRASGNRLEGVRWSVTWETGDTPVELQGGSVGLAALVCFDRLQHGLPLGAETSWAFTGAVDREGAVRGVAEGNARALTNKLRAAERRNVVVAGEDLDIAQQIVDAAGISCRLHPANNLEEALALLDARKPGWMSDDATTAVGRSDELAMLGAAADRAARGRVVVSCLTGEPGIGKTRLAREFAIRALAEGWQIAWGTCFEAEATVAYRPAVAVVRSLLAGFDDTETIIADSREDMAILLPELEHGRKSRRAKRIGSERQLAVFDAVARAVRHAADLHPVMIVVDDLHWADRPSLLLFGHLVRHCADRPVLFVVGFRQYEVSEDHPVVQWLADSRAIAEVDELRLAGLDEAGTDQLLTELSGRQAPLAFTAAMMSVTRGNPLFIHELARDARASGALDPRRETWNVRVQGSHLPAGLSVVLSRRLRTLSPVAQELCRYVATSTDGITFDVLCAASGIDHFTVLDALDQAVDAGVLDEQARDGVGFIYEFSHVLFRDALLERATAARRARYHFALATALSAVPDYDERWVADIAYHLHRAGRLGDPPAAVAACRRSGELAMARTAFDDAATHFERAVEAAGWVADTSGATIAELELCQAEAFHRAGNRTGRQKLAERSFDRAGRAGDAATMGRAALIHGGARSTYGLPSMVTMALLANALKALEGDPQGRVDLRAQVISRLAQETYHVQRFDEAKAQSALALELISDASGPGVRAAVLDGRAWTLHTPDDLVERLRLADEMIGEAVRAGDPEWEMMGRSWRCSALLELGDIRGIDVELSRLSVLSRDAPVPSHLFRVATMRCTREMMSGRYEAGAELAEQAHRIGVGIEPENALQTLCAQMLGMLREQGLLAGLVDTAEQMVADFPMVPGWRSALAFVNHQAGQIDRARQLFDELAVGDFIIVPRDLAWMQAHSYLAELAAAFDDRPAAEVLYRLMAPFTGRNVGLYDIASNGSVDHYLGLLAATGGQRDAAIGHLRRAVIFNDGSRQVPAASRSRVALARLLESGTEPERREAETLVRAASEAAEALGLVSIAVEINASAPDIQAVR